VFSTNPSRFVSAIDNKIVGLIKGWIELMRVEARNQANKWIKCPVILSDSGARLIRQILERKFDISSIYSNSTPDRICSNNSISTEFFSGAFYAYEFKFAWGDKNRFIYSKQSLETLLSQESLIAYSPKEHVSKLFEAAMNGHKTDLSVTFSGGEKLSAHSYVIQTFSPKLMVAMMRCSGIAPIESILHCNYELTRMIVQFMYTGEFPENLDMVQLQKLNQAAVEYEIAPLQKWVSAKLEQMATTSINIDDHREEFFKIAASTKSVDMLSKCFARAETNDTFLFSLMTFISCENIQVLVDAVDTKNYPIVTKALLQKALQLRKIG